MNINRLLFAGLVVLIAAAVTFGGPALIISNALAALMALTLLAKTLPRGDFGLLPFGTWAVVLSCLLLAGVTVHLTFPMAVFISITCLLGMIALPRGRPAVVASEQLQS